MEVILNLPYEVKVIEASFTFFSVTCLYTSNFIFGRFEPYRNASETTRKNWNVRFASTVHAVVVAFMATIILINNWKISHNNPIWGTPYGTETVLSILLGYMLEDLLMVTMYVWAGWKFGLADIVHHLAVMLVAASVLKYKYIYSVSLVRALAEFSTPFVHIRWFMMKSNMEDNKWYLRNGIVLAVFFLIFRIAAMPYLYMINYLYYDQIKTLGFLQVLIVMGMAMDYLNLVWFYKIVTLLFAYIKNPKQE